MSRMPERAFGVELEIQIAPDKIYPEDCAQVLKEAGILAGSRNYSHETVSYWKVTTDGSVHSGYEVVSPILKGAAGLEQVEKVCKALQAAGYGVNNSCGLHVHVDARDFDRKAVVRLARQFLIEEHNFDKFVNERRLTNTFCLSNLSNFRWQGSRLATIKFAHHQIGHSAMNIYRRIARSRYYKLNLDALWRHHTVEYRAHEGSIDPVTVLRWIRLCVLFTSGAIHTANESVDRVDELYVETEPEQTLARFEAMAYRKGRRRKMKADALREPRGRRRPRGNLQQIDIEGQHPWSDSVVAAAQGILASDWRPGVAYGIGALVTVGNDLYAARVEIFSSVYVEHPTNNSSVWHRRSCNETGDSLETCLCARHVERRAQILYRRQQAQAERQMA